MHLQASCAQLHASADPCSHLQVQHELEADRNALLLLAQ